METAKTKASAPQSPETKRNNWLWIPSLYFAQGIPYVVVMTMSVIMYKRLGVSNTDVALYTSLLYLPWVIKPLWSPFVDIFKTKRTWILGMQFLIAIALLVAGASIQTATFFTLSLAIFWVMAFSSSTHDIAADGFYMLSLSKHDQTWWNGIRSTAYRIAMIVGSGLLIVLAGVLENTHGLAPVEISISAKQNAAMVSEINPDSVQVVPQEGELKLIAQPASLDIAVARVPAESAKLVIDKAKAWNTEHGFFEEIVITKDKTESWWSRHVSGPMGKVWDSVITDPLGGFLKTHFPKENKAKPTTAGSVGILYFTLSKEPPAGKNIVVNFAKQPHGFEYIGFGVTADFKIVQGERFVFNTKNWNVPFAAVIQLDPKLQNETSAVYKTRSGNIPLAWSITLFFLGGLFLAFCIYHKFVLPKPAADVAVVSGKSLFSDFFGTLGSYFKKPQIVTGLLFILLYRFPEAQGVKMINPFLLDTREVGGLGLTTSEVGLAYGTFGVLSLTFGGLAGAFLAAKHGLKKMLPIMVCAIHLPNLAFLYLSFMQPDTFGTIAGCIAIEQFGYGFGFAAYMLFLLYFADGAHKTAHYAVCTGFMALGMMLPGMWSGWLADIIGYKHFFVWVMLSTIPGFLVAFLVKVDPEFGKKAPAKA
ncbi:MAG: transporter, family, beta-lactamase induction signal transducer AmpG [Verrucomicrobiales bacterium]|nr:transporter, family, beta-lactamase induction signal transducer AmpG [Verrucomicrobiales bacterium]